MEDQPAIRIKQYVYFAAASEILTGEELTAAIGMTADSLRERRLLRLSPRQVMVRHVWAVECKTPGLRINEQVGQVLRRIEPALAGLRRLADDPRVRLYLQLVRFFNDENGEVESFEAGIDPDGTFYERLGGQHQLLGWTLTPEQLMLLASLNASLDADEFN